MALLCAGCGGGKPTGSRDEAALLNDLREGNSKARLAAAQRLGRIGSASAVPGLARSLYDLRSDVRLAAAEALGVIGAPAAVAPLSRALESKEWRMRRAAADALGKISDPGVIEPLAGALADKEGAVTTVAAVALGRIGAPAVPAVTKLLAHQTPEARAAAAYALGRIGDDSGIPPLRPRLDDDAPAARLAAADALGKLGDAESASRIAQMLSDADPDVVKGVHKPLTALGTNAVPALMAVVSGEHREARVAALSLLGLAGDPRAVGTFLENAGDKDKWIADRARRSLEQLVEAGRGVPELVAALKDSNAAIRRTAVGYLKRRPKDIAADALRTALKDEEPVVRRTAAEILQARADRKEIGATVSLLEDQDFAVRTAAATALASVGNTRGNDVLLETLRRTIPLVRNMQKRRESNPSVNRIVAAMNGLANTRDKRAVELLLPLVRHPNRRISCPAVEALGRIGDERAVDALLPLLREDKGKHRDYGTPMKLACVALGRIGDPRAFDPLVKLMNDTLHRWWTPIRVEAIKGMLLIDKQRAVEPLIHALDKTEMLDIYQIDHTCKILADIGDPKAIPHMIPFLLSDIPTTRAGTALALKHMAETSPDCMKELVLQLKQPNAKTRSILGLVIARIGKPALPYLLEAMKDKDPQLRHGAAWTLGSMKNERSVEPLVTALADKSEHVRAAAAWALGSIGTTNAVPPLIKLTADENPRPRIGAVTALGDIGDNRAVETLTKIAEQDKEARVREAAQAALKKISRKSTKSAR